MSSMHYLWQLSHGQRIPSSSTFLMYSLVSQKLREYLNVITLNSPNESPEILDERTFSQKN